MVTTADSIDKFVTLSQIDEAWFNFFNCAYSGVDILASLFLFDGDPIQMFIRTWPYSENSPDRHFPSIAIELVRPPVPARRRRHSLSGGITIEEDLEVAEPYRIVIPDPEPYDVEYNIHLLSRTVDSDNALLEGLIANVLINDTLEINEEPWNMFFENPISSNEIIGDQITYHHVYPVRVEVNMAATGRRITVPVVTTVASDTEILEI